MFWKQIITVVHMCSLKILISNMIFHILLGDGNNASVSILTLKNLSNSALQAATIFGHHGEWRKYSATKILAKVANWQPTDKKSNLIEKLSMIGRI